MLPRLSKSAPRIGTGSHVCFRALGARGTFLSWPGRGSGVSCKTQRAPCHCTPPWCSFTRAVSGSPSSDGLRGFLCFAHGVTTRGEMDLVQQAEDSAHTWAGATLRHCVVPGSLSSASTSCQSPSEVRPAQCPWRWQVGVLRERRAPRRRSAGGYELRSRRPAGFLVKLWNRAQRWFPT